MKSQYGRVVFMWSLDEEGLVVSMWLMEEEGLVVSMWLMEEEGLVGFLCCFNAGWRTQRKSCEAKVVNVRVQLLARSPLKAVETLVPRASSSTALYVGSEKTPQHVLT
jgi:hypothetical protein